MQYSPRYGLLVLLFTAMECYYLPKRQNTQYPSVLEYPLTNQQLENYVFHGSEVKEALEEQIPVEELTGIFGAQEGGDERIQEIPLGMEELPLGMEELPLGMEELPLGIQDIPLGIPDEEKNVPGEPLTPLDFANAKKIGE